MLAQKDCGSSAKIWKPSIPYQHHPSDSQGHGRLHQHMWCKAGLCLGTYSGLFFAVVLQDATSGLKAVVFLQMRTDGRLLNLATLRAERKVGDIIVHDPLFADSCALVAHLLEDLQEITSHFASAAKDFRLTIGLKSTEVLYQLALGSSFVETNCPIDDACLNPVTKFCYLGSIVSSLASLGLEVESRTRMASFAFSQLKDCVWSQNIRLATKCKVYDVVSISETLMPD